ncbi:MAG: BRO family protein, partial [Pseudomonadota bacterium]
DEKDGVGITDPIGRLQETSIISESGLYALVFRSRKPAAKEFSRWVRHEVLPSIRKTGQYSLNGDVADDSDAAPVELHPDSVTWIKICRESRLIHGEVAARDLWKMSPLPKTEGMKAAVGLADRANGDACTEAEGLACLQHILDYEITIPGFMSSLTIREAIAHVQKKGTPTTTMNRELRKMGIGFSHDYKSVLIANCHPGLAQVFRNSPWLPRQGARGDWVLALRCVPGSEVGRTAWFHEVHSRCTLIPIDWLVGENPDADVAVS